MDLQLQTCSDVTYNRTAFPTLLRHQSRAAVESSSEYILLSVLHQLLEGQCNPDLRLLGWLDEGVTINLYNDDGYTTTPDLEMGTTTITVKVEGETASAAGEGMMLNCDDIIIGE